MSNKSEGRDRRISNEELKTFIELAASLGVFGWLTKMLKPIIQKGFERLEAETRNTLILSIEKWADQTVHEVEHALINYDNPTKKELAVKLLIERIRKNKIVGYFPPEVISGYIEEAVKMMKKGN